MITKETLHNAKTCLRCHGAGEVANNGGWTKCRRCGGSGISPVVVACSYCGAPPGEPCERNGAAVNGATHDYFHKPRVQAVVDRGNS